MALWTPAQIATALWLDAADANTITLNGSTVSEWRDKSGNAKHAVQATASNQPAVITAEQNGLGVISLDGIDDYLTTATLTLECPTSLFIVYKPDTLAGYRSVINQQYGDVAGTPWQIYVDSTGKVIDWRTGGYSTGAVAGQYLIYEQIQPVADTILHWGNGIAGTGDTLASAYPQSKAISIGRNQTYGDIGWADGKIAEILLIKSAIDTATRQKIEGYLAWKWGLAAALAADHPYKSAAPIIPDNTVTLSLDQPISLAQRVRLSLDQPIALRKLLTLSLDQSCGMELAMTLIQRCRAMPSVTLSLNQWVRSLRRVTLSLDQHVGVCPRVRLSLDQRVRMPGRVTLSLDQAVVIAGQRLTLSLDQPVRMDRNGRVTLSLAQPCAIADGTAIRQEISLSVTVGGRAVDPDFVSIKTDDSDGFMSATIRFPDFQQYLLCRVGEEVIITELLDDLPAEITILEVKTLTNPEEPGAADHILTAVSPTAALDEEPLTDDLGPGVADELMAAQIASRGFSLDWHGVAGWPFLAGELMAENESLYAVMVRLASASGAFLQSIPDGETIRLRQEYAVNVEAWPTAATILEINDQDHIFSIDEQPDERDGFNAFLVGGQSAAAGNYRLDDKALTATTKDIRFYQWPWNEAAQIVLGHTGGDWVSIDYLGVFEEQIKNEEVVITAGIGKLQFPCYGPPSVRYKEDGLGAVSYEEDGTITTAQLGDALLDATYTTRFRKWILTDPKAEHLLIYIP